MGEPAWSIHEAPISHRITSIHTPQVRPLACLETRVCEGSLHPGTSTSIRCHCIQVGDWPAWIRQSAAGLFSHPGTSTSLPSSSHIQVVDTGVGMPPEVLPRIFNEVLSHPYTHHLTRASSTHHPYTYFRSTISPIYTPPRPCKYHLTHTYIHASSYPYSYHLTHIHTTLPPHAGAANQPRRAAARRRLRPRPHAHQGAAHFI